MADGRNLLTSGLALLVVGKGGVGKTTVAAALARAAAREGSRVLLVELDGKPAIPRLFGSETLLSYTPITVDLGDDVSGSVTLRRLTPNDALTEYLADHGFGPLARRLTSSGLLEMLATAIPGLGETLVMGKLKSLQASGTYDLVVIDAPATGHARTLLTSAAGIIEAARSGPIRTQADEVAAFLGDPTRCRVLLVTLPEELPVTEAIDAAFAVEDEAGVALGPVIVNAMVVPDPAWLVSPKAAAKAAKVTLTAPQLATLTAACSALVARHEEAEAQRARLAAELPLPQLLLPELTAAEIDDRGVAILAAALTEALAASEEVGS